MGLPEASSKSHSSKQNKKNSSLSLKKINKKVYCNFATVLSPLVISLNFTSAGKNYDHLTPVRNLLQHSAMKA